MIEPWEHEPDYWSERVGDVHLIAIRDPRYRYWNGYIGVHQKWWSFIDAEKLKLHHDPTFFGTRERFGGRPGFFYLGFDCHRISKGPDGLHDYSPDDYRSNSSRVNGGTYRPLTYVKLICYQAATDIAKQRWWLRVLWLSLKARIKSWWHRLRPPSCDKCDGKGTVTLAGMPEHNIPPLDTACPWCTPKERRTAN